MQIIRNKKIITLSYETNEAFHPFGNAGAFQARISWDNSLTKSKSCLEKKKKKKILYNMLNYFFKSLLKNF